MADRFEDLGIAPELLAAVESLGWDAPTGLQRDALPVIRRGNNVVLHASAGSGHVGAYALGILDRLAGAGAPATSASAPRALVLVPDDDGASRTADSLARLAAPAGLSAGARGAGWTTAPVDLLVLTPAAAAAAIRDSALKLDPLDALVVDGLDQIDAIGHWDELETIIDITAADAQRVVVTGRFGRRIEGFIERHVRRALTVPARPADAEKEPSGGATIRYRVVADRQKAAAMVALVADAGPGEVAIVTRTRQRAETLERSLAGRGVAPAGEAAGRVLVLPRTEADRRSTRAEVISADVPFDASGLAELHGRGGVVLVTARERDHLLRIGRRAGFTLRALPEPAPVAASPAEALRDRIRQLLGDSAPADAGPAHLAADLALIEPLLDEFPAAEIAAAALHLARTGTAGLAGSTPESAAATGAGQAAAAQRPGAGAPPPAEATTWTHLFVTGGSRDDIGTGDILGAMTGEAGITADQVGKIDVRESHTTVEVATPVAARVIEALNGRTVKGRSLRVDYDRKSGGSRQDAGGRPSRGSSKGAPKAGSKGGPRGGRSGPRR